jgi:hypothetical protein
VGEPETFASRISYRQTKLLIKGRLQDVAMRLGLPTFVVLLAVHFACAGPGSDTLYLCGARAFAEVLRIARVSPLVNVPPWQNAVLLQNRPNPVSNRTNIYFSVARSGPASLRLFDSKGREVGYFPIGGDGLATAGLWYCARFDASRVSSGQYYYRLQTAGFVAVKKMVVVR